MKKLIHATQSGFTLIETIIYMGILSILLIVFMELFGAIIDVQTESQSTSSVAQDSQYIYNKLAYDLHRAENITLPAAPGETSSVLQVQIDGVDYEYSVVADNLVVSESEDTNQLNSYNTTISNLSVQRIGNGIAPDTLRISYTITSKTQTDGRRESQNISTTIGLRE